MISNPEKLMKAIGGATITGICYSVYGMATSGKLSNLFNVEDDFEDEKAPEKPILVVAEIAPEVEEPVEEVVEEVNVAPEIVKPPVKPGPKSFFDFQKDISHGTVGWAGSRQLLAPVKSEFGSSKQKDFAAAPSYSESQLFKKAHAELKADPHKEDVLMNACKIAYSKDHHWDREIGIDVYRYCLI